MINCPIQNTASLNNDWKQVRSRRKISQGFGNKLIINRKDIYKQYGIIGHDGKDYAVKQGTPIFAPFAGWIKVKNSGNRGYGLHVKIRSKELKLEMVLGHLNLTVRPYGDFVKTGDLLAYSGNTGNSFGDHLHAGLRGIIESWEENIFRWPVKDYDNGYFGYFDHTEYTIEWRGTHAQNEL